MSRRGRSRRLAAAVVAAGLVTLAAATPASADVASEGLWYFDVLNVQAAHDAGFTGEGVTIAVIDSAINPDIATLRGADLRVQESPDCYIDGVQTPVVTDDVPLAFHGTNATALIIGTGAGDDGQVGVKGVAPGATVLYYRVDTHLDERCQDPNGVEKISAIGEAIDDAVTAGADIISMSIVFNPDELTYHAVARALREEVILVSGLSNYSADSIPNAWSARMNGTVSVQAIDRTGAAANIDPYVDVAGPGVDILVHGSDTAGWSSQSLRKGTSLATPIVAGFLAVTSQKYPAATPNQLIQSLIRNTGVEDHELMYSDSGIGYGVVSLTHLLRTDPTEYPDVNPLLVEDREPTPEEVAVGSDGPEVPGDPSPAPAPAADATGLLVMLGGVGLVAVAGALVAVVLVARRRGRRAGQSALDARGGP